MAYVKKYIKGKVIRTANEAIELILNKKVIFYNHKPNTYGWTQNWSIVAIKSYVNSGLLFIAKENKCLPN